MNISKQIKELRKSCGFSQQELADKSGLSRVSIGQIERGQSAPTLKNIKRIASALNSEFIIYIQKNNVI